MAKRTIIFLAALLLLMAGPAFIKYKQIQLAMASMAGNTRPAANIEAAEVRHEMWQTRVAAVGTLTARDGIDLKNEVEGVIETIHAASGQQVEAGDLLVSINDDVEQADLVALQSQEVLAQANFDRTRRMWEKQTASQREYDDASSTLQVAQANMAQVRARIAKKNIRAPFSGVLRYPQRQQGTIRITWHQTFQPAGRQRSVRRFFRTGKLFSGNQPGSRGAVQGQCLPRHDVHGRGQGHRSQG